MGWWWGWMNPWVTAAADAAAAEADALLPLLLLLSVPESGGDGDEFWTDEAVEVSQRPLTPLAAAFGSSRGVFLRFFHLARRF